MSERQKYVKRADQKVHAVRLDLDTDGFTYRKWGAEQRCKRGDWLVDNGGEVYTVDGDSFARTYRHVGEKSGARFGVAAPSPAEGEAGARVRLTPPRLDSGALPLLALLSLTNYSTSA